MYMDKLDGRIGNEFLDAKAAETRAAQAAIARPGGPPDGEPELHRGGRPATGTGAPRARPVRESAASRKTQTPKSRTLELHLEGRRTHREIPPTF
jgi:hypothetical protein